ncbi:MAG: VRR-NUC domain-containing protein [Bdellovibrionales bacterium]
MKKSLRVNSQSQYTASAVGKARGPREHAIERQIRTFLAAKGIFHWKAKTVGTWDPRQKIFRKTAGYMKGVSDLIGIYNGRFLAIEVKSFSGKPSQDQLLFQHRVRENGGIAFIARSWEEVRDKLEHWRSYTIEEVRE